MQVSNLYTYIRGNRYKCYTGQKNIEISTLRYVTLCCNTLKNVTDFGKYWFVHEKNLEKKLRQHVKNRGGLCLKWVSPGFTGVPDRICLLPGGRVVFVELKRPGLKDGLSARQKRVIGQLKSLGQKVLVVRSEEDFSKI